MIRAILTDIEGTTSSLSFVKDVLFPYAARHLPDFVRAHLDQTTVQERLAAAAEIAGLPISDTQGLIEQLTRWIAADQKITPLKDLQGMIWEAGYASGDYQAHVYADAERALRAWQEQGLDLYVYSSGSIYAQKLFFQYSQFGDIRGLFSDYFDTTSGAKSAPESYLTIAQAIGLSPAEILFLSDVEAELDGARSAGFKTIRLVRMEDYGIEPSAASSAHVAVAGFDEVSKYLK